MRQFIEKKISNCKAILKKEENLEEIRYYEGFLNCLKMIKRQTEFLKEEKKKN